MSSVYYQPYWSRSDELEHHGIIGQKWGVRRFQNKDGTLTELGKKRISNKASKSGMYARDDNEEISFPKGTKLYRVAINGQDPDSNMYVTRNKMDRNYYRMVYGESIMTVGEDARNIKENTYTTTEELKIPSFNTRKAVYAELAKDKKLLNEVVQDLATGYVKRYGLIKASSLKDAREYVKDSQLDKDSKKVLERLIKESVPYGKTKVKELEDKNPIVSTRAMAHIIGASQKAREAYVNILKKYGYNATVDDYGRKGLYGTAGETSEALLIFNPKSSTTKNKTKVVPIYKTEKEQRDKILDSLKYDAKVLNNELSKEQLKIYNSMMRKREVATLASSLVPIIPGMMYSNAAKKANLRINALEQEKRRQWK